MSAHVSAWWLLLAYAAGQVTTFGALFIGSVLKARRTSLDSETEEALTAEATALTGQLLERLRARHDPNVVDLATERRRRRGGVL